MYGGRITSEERSAISTYVGAGVAIVLAVVGIYFFFLAQKEKKETTTFDPNRPVPTDTVLKGRLKAEEYAVVRGNGSQTPFQNEFWNNEKTGIYVDVITGEPLFVSVDKFDGKVGLPTFTKPISYDLLVELPDNTNEMQRTQVRAKRSNARLGHVFADPQSPTGRRYVIYSAAFHFVPVEQMKDRGYEAYIAVVEKKQGFCRHAALRRLISSFLLQPLGNFCRCYFLGKIRSERWVKSAKQQEELFDYGKEMFRNGIGRVCIRVWNCSALECRHGYD